MLKFYGYSDDTVICEDTSKKPEVRKREGMRDLVLNNYAIYDDEMFDVAAEQYNVGDRLVVTARLVDLWWEFSVRPLFDIDKTDPCAATVPNWDISMRRYIPRDGTVRALSHTMELLIDAPPGTSVTVLEREYTGE